MIEIYTNTVGKSRIVDHNSQTESLLRRQWFDDFETELKNKYPQLMQKVTFRVVGSVAEGLTSSTSDIDIVIHSASSEELLIPQIRQAIFTLLSEMKMLGKQTYDVEVRPVEDRGMFSVIANFRRQK